MRLLRGEMRLDLEPARLLVTVIAFGIVAIIVDRIIGLVLIPTSTSVDIAHHLALTDWIVREGALPNKPSPNLNEMVSYPFGVHLLSAVTVKALGIAPLKAMTLVGFGLLGFLASALVGIAGRLADQLGFTLRPVLKWSTALLCTTALLFASHYSIGLLDQDYFFAQVFGLYLLVATAFFLLDTSHDVNPWSIAASGAALIYAYPLYFPIFIAMWLPGVIHRPRKFALFTGLCFLAAASLFLPGRLATGISILNNNGGTIPITIARLGGGIVLIPCLIGVATCLFYGCRRALWPVLTIPFGVIAALAEALAVLFFTGSVGGSTYQALKLVYAALYIAFGTLPIVVFMALRYLNSRAIITILAPLTAGALVILSVFSVDLRRQPPVISSEEYQLAQWTANTFPRSEVDVLIPGIPGYILWVGIFGQPRNIIAATYLSSGCNLLDHWIEDGKPYLIFLPSQSESVQASGQRFTVVQTNGDAVLIHRTESIPHATTLPPECR